MLEVDLMRLIQVSLTKEGCRLFRNNVGLFKTKDGRTIRTGLFVGSSDLIGWYKGRFLAVEVKQPGEKAKNEQQNFIDEVNRSGGIAFVAHSPEEAVECLRSTFSN